MGLTFKPVDWAKQIALHNVVGFIPSVEGLKKKAWGSLKRKGLFFQTEAEILPELLAFRLKTTKAILAGNSSLLVYTHTHMHTPPHTPTPTPTPHTHTHTPHLPTHPHLHTHTHTHTHTPIGSVSLENPDIEAIWLTWAGSAVWCDLRFRNHCYFRERELSLGSERKAERPGRLFWSCRCDLTVAWQWLEVTGFEKYFAGFSDSSDEACERNR